MKNLKQLSAVALAIILASGISGCASFERCSPENCASDKQTLAELNRVLALHRELGEPAAIHTQVINGVAYLDGFVDTELEQRDAERIALEVSGVRDVVNSLSVRNSR